jgi:hypothetical protein
MLLKFPQNPAKTRGPSWNVAINHHAIVMRFYGILGFQDHVQDFFPLPGTLRETSRTGAKSRKNFFCELVGLPYGPSLWG